MLASGPMNPAPNLILVGPTGAGKTSIGRRMAERLGLRFVDADQQLEAQTGASVSIIFECEGEAGFRARESALIQALCRQQGLLLATGAGAVLDPANRRAMRMGGFVVHLDTGVDQQLARLDKDRTRPLLQTPDRRERLEAMARVRGPLYAEVADLRFESAENAVARATEALLAQVLARWKRSEPMPPAPLESTP